MLTGKSITDEDIRNCWDDAKRRWLYVNEDDARLALSSVPIFGVGDLQGYWRSRDTARQRCAMSINAATPLTVTAITDEHLKALFMAHCECRPLDLWRTRYEHSHDCDLDIPDDIRKAGGWLGVIESACRDARSRCVDYWNTDLASDIYAPLLATAWTTNLDNATRTHVAD